MSHEPTPPHPTDNELQHAREQDVETRTVQLKERFGLDDPRAVAPRCESCRGPLTLDGQGYSCQDSECLAYGYVVLTSGGPAVATSRAEAPDDNLRCSRCGRFHSDNVKCPEAPPALTTITVACPSCNGVIFSVPCLTCQNSGRLKCYLASDVSPLLTRLARYEQQEKEKQSRVDSL